MRISEAWWSFFKVPGPGRGGGRTRVIFGFRLFSLSSSTLDHSATAPPYLVKLNGSFQVRQAHHKFLWSLWWAWDLLCLRKFEACYSSTPEWTRCTFWPPLPGNTTWLSFSNRERKIKRRIKKVVLSQSRKWNKAGSKNKKWSFPFPVLPFSQ